MRASGNLAGVSFMDAPRYHRDREQWREIISNSGYSFTVDAMKFFSSRVSWDTLTAYRDGYAFITSEQHRPLYNDWEPRKYTVRYWNPTDRSNHLREFQEFATLAQAKKHLTKLIDNQERE